MSGVGETDIDMEGQWMNKEKKEVTSNEDYKNR